MSNIHRLRYLVCFSNSHKWEGDCIAEQTYNKSDQENMHHAALSYLLTSILSRLGILFEKEINNQLQLYT